jgi:uncharacterized membrane protein YbhN (UPF0104 family)
MQSPQGLLGRPPTRSTALLAGTALLGVAAALSLWNAGHNENADELAGALTELPWQAMGAVAALTGLVAVHFLSAATAVRALSGNSVALRPTALAQLAAGAADRIVPNGMGGAGVNLRYLCRAGLPPGAAVSALGVLALVGAVTDAAYGALVTVAGPHLGLTGAPQELRSLAAGGIQIGHRHSWLLLGLLAGVTLVLLVRRRGQLTAIRSGAGQALAHLRDLAVHPRRLGIAAAASMATTVVMSAGFVITVQTWGTGRTPVPTGALVAMYLVGAAVTGATPLPPFFGATEAALVAALALAGYPLSSAALTVGIFRGVTYWIPLPIGIWAARRLRRHNLI